MLNFDIKRIIQRLGRRKLRRPVPVLAVAPPRAVVPSTHQQAATSLVDRSRVMSIAHRNQLLKVSSDGAHPDIVDFARAFLKELDARGMPFFPHCYVRSAQEQDRLFKAGVTKARAGQSPHNHGLAVDIVHDGKYWDLSGKQWAVVGMIGKEVARRRNIKIEWGGDWRFYDPAHWQLADWKKYAGN